jgi:hypothetical protein
MSEVKVNKISPRTNCGTVQLGDSGDTITIPAGATITNNGTQTGFGRTGTVDWDTTAKTASFTAVSGNGYFVNTTSGSITMNLPASPSAGDIVAIKDYAYTFNTNNFIVDGNGSPIGGVAGAIPVTYSTNGTSKTFVYVDGTKGWLVTNESTDTSQESNILFVTATGGTIKTCGNYKTHIFTGPGTFCVSCGGNACGSNTVEYFVIAGGGSGGAYSGANEGLGGGGAGGFRLSSGACIPAPTMSPLAACVSALPVTVQGYPITVGGGGSRTDVGTQDPAPGNPGSNSIFSTITSAGGGGGGPSPTGNGFNGGSGGGGNRGNSTTGVGGTGNTPPVSPPQGFNGGGGTPLAQQGSPAPFPSRNGGGGGGASENGAGGNVPAAGTGGAGSFVADAFIGGCAPSYGEAGPVGSTRYFAGGGGGSGGSGGQPGGVGGGGDGRQSTNGNDGTTNTGGGGGGSNTAPTPGGGGNGGSGIIMIRYKYQ